MSFNEQALIASILIEPKLLKRVDIAPEDLADEHAQALLEAAFHTDGDAVVIAHAAGDEHMKYALDAVQLPIQYNNIDDYVRLVKQEIQQRKAFHIICDMQSASISGDLNEIRVQMDKLDDVLKDRDDRGEASIRQMMAQFLGEQSRPVTYMRTGFGKLDRYTYISHGDYVVIGGRPSAGKTAFAIALASNMAKQYKVVFFSLETGASKIMDRLMASRFGIPFQTIKRHELTEESRQKIVGDYQSMAGLKLTFVDAAGYDVSMIQAKAQKLEADIVFIDYLGLIRSEESSRYEKVTNISVGLHTFAQKTKTTVFALSQLNREAANGTRGNKEPTMEDLRESGQIEQDADVILLLNYTGKQNETPDYQVIIGKNKEGRVGKIPFKFYGETQRFYAEDWR